MQAIAGPIGLILNVAFFVMIMHIIMSWLINFQVLNLRQPLVAQIWDGLNRLLEPIYRPIRNILPNTGALDLAPLVAFLILISLRDYILPTVLCGGYPLGYCR
ncbi:YggT family protein [Mesobacterium sp. TK19101]|uniref:YggT family protein n=1 Tax=Mesobacterium hydrothermale TaxID=3111907 RepID=A0ABU6HCN1_9RHOB|nr:YggT family protein [Mesobacterium sp. TK19101]MEC3859746.1 YggT family protein [Mesobacterium sp. TK19101]